MFDEQCVVSSLVQRDIDEFKHLICKKIDDFYKSKDPRKSISCKEVMDFISNLHCMLDCFLHDEGVEK